MVLIDKSFMVVSHQDAVYYQGQYYYSTVHVYMISVNGKVRTMRVRLGDLGYSSLDCPRGKYLDSCIKSELASRRNVSND